MKTEENFNKLNQMCSKVLKDEPQPWDEDEYNERQRLELFKFDSEENFRKHVQSVKKCCKKVTITLELKIYFFCTEKIFF